MASGLARGLSPGVSGVPTAKLVASQKKELAAITPETIEGRVRAHGRLGRPPTAEAEGE